MHKPLLVLAFSTALNACNPVPSKSPSIPVSPENSPLASTITAVQESEYTKYTAVDFARNDCSKAIGLFLSRLNPPPRLKDFPIPPECLDSARTAEQTARESRSFSTITHNLKEDIGTQTSCETPYVTCLRQQIDDFWSATSDYSKAWLKHWIGITDCEKERAACYQIARVDEEKNYN